MLNIKTLENTGFFETLELASGDILFDEGDIDNNLYIIKKGDLSIEKYTNNEKNESKQLAILEQSSIFGEGSLNNSDPKQVKIIAINKVVLLKIDTENKFEEFILKNTKLGIELLSQIIEISNKRLLESNFIVTSTYSMSNHISEIMEFNNKNLFKIIDEFEKTINSEYVLYIERNPVIKDFVTVKYDTRKKGKMQDNSVELFDNILDINDLKKNGIELEKHNLISELKNANEIIGYLIIGESDHEFSDGQKKSITSISALIAGIIKQKQYFEENRDIEFSKN